VEARFAVKFCSGAQTFRIGKHQTFYYWPIVCTIWRYTFVPLKDIRSKYV